MKRHPRHYRRRHPMVAGCMSGLALLLSINVCFMLYSSYMLVFEPDDPTSQEIRSAGGDLWASPPDSDWLTPLLALIPQAPLAAPSSAMVATAANLPIVPQLPLEMENTLFALTYGRKDGWGTLRKAETGSSAVTMAAEFAQEVGAKTNRRVIPIVNPVIREKLQHRYDTHGDPWLDEIIQNAAANGVIVMLDIQLGNECVELGKQIIADYAHYAHVWFDVDVEHSCGGLMDASQLDELASYVNEQRQAHGIQAPALFGFWYFQEGSLRGYPQKQHGNILTVPMFDGYVSNGDLALKVATGYKRLNEVGGGPAGVMWFPEHDANISLDQIMQAFPDALVVARQ